MTFFVLPQEELGGGEQVRGDEMHCGKSDRGGGDIDQSGRPESNPYLPKKNQLRCPAPNITTS